MLKHVKANKIHNKDFDFVFLLYQIELHCSQFTNWGFFWIAIYYIWRLN